MSSFKSVAAAKRDGYIDLKPWLYGDDFIEVRGRILIKDPLEALSKSAWRSRGCCLKVNQEPHATITRRVDAARKAVTYHVYRIDQVVSLALGLGGTEHTSESNC